MEPVSQLVMVLAQLGSAAMVFLGHQVLYSTILLGILLTLGFILKIQRPRWQSAMLLLVVLRLLLPPDFHLPYSARAMVDHLWQKRGILTQQMPISPEKPLPLHPGPSLAARPSPNQEEDPLPGPVALLQASRPTAASPRTWHPWGPPLILLGWLMGVCAFSWHHHQRRRFFMHIIHASRGVAGRKVLDAANGWRAWLGIRRKVRLVTSSAYLTPFTIGMLRPVIFIPRALLGDDNEETMHAILAHEMVHIKRWDDLRIVLFTLIQSVYFFDPVVWYVNRRLAVIRERLCDAAVLSTGRIDVSAYGRGILNVLKLNLVTEGPSVLLPTAGFGSQKRALVGRIQAITKEATMEKSHTTRTFAIVAMLGLFLLPMAPAGLVTAQEEGGALEKRFAFIRPMSGWIAGRFDPQRHVYTPLPPALVEQSAASNPNLKKPQDQWHTFQTNLAKERHPGVDYMTGGQPVRAMADGIVHFIGETPKGSLNPGGLYVRVVHDRYDGLKQSFYPRVPLYRYQAYRTTYYHLSHVEVGHWQAVKRGEIIGRGTVYGPKNQEMVKIVLEERGNWVNPEDYGPRHTHLPYRGEGQNLELDLEEMNRRLDRQSDIVERFNQFYAEADKDDIYNKIHGVIDTEKFKGFPVEWSTLDRFRYLSLRYAEAPERFPDLSPADYNSFKGEFFGNQAIVLTLPF